jgi:hypothetical protein
MRQLYDLRIHQNHPEILVHITRNANNLTYTYTWRDYLYFMLTQVLQTGPPNYRPLIECTQETFPEDTLEIVSIYTCRWCKRQFDQFDYWIQHISDPHINTGSGREQ